MPDGSGDSTTKDIWDRAVAKALEDKRRYRPSEPPWRNPLDDHDYDQLGRRQPRRIPMSVLLGSATGIEDRVRRVPMRAIAENGCDDDGVYALLACPCGHHPIVRHTLAKCPGCERYYIGAGDLVFVIYGEMTPPDRRSDASSVVAS